MRRTDFPEALHKSAMFKGTQKSRKAELKSSNWKLPKMFPLFIIILRRRGQCTFGKYVELYTLEGKILSSLGRG